MASQTVIDELCNAARNREVQQGLPIINQMIEDDDEGEIPSSIEIAGAWMTDDELRLYAELLELESQFVSACWAESTNDVGALTRDWACLDDEDEAIQKDWANLTPAQCVIKYLDERWSHGEYIGQIVGVFDELPEAVQQEIRTPLINAIKHAIEHGVDH